MVRFFLASRVALLAILLSPASLAGEESVPPRVRVEIQAVGEIGGGIAVATPILTGAAAETVHRNLDAAGAAVLELAPGTWSVAIESPGFWSERRRIQVEQGGEAVDLVVLPAAKVTGQLSLPRGESAPEEVAAEFRWSRPEQPEVGLERGSSVCPVGEELRFDCVLPAGRLDVGIKARSFVPAWLWDRSLAKGSTVDLGTIDLRRGSSVSGSIEVVEGTGDPRDALLRLESLDIPGGASPTSERDRQVLRLETRANPRGHFLFEAVPPGSYALIVDLAGYAPVRRSGIPVVLDSESVISEPLELFQSRKLAVGATPPLDPRGKRWTVRMRAIEDADAEPRDAVLSDEGAVVLDAVIPGHYSVTLQDAEGSRRWWREVEIEPGQEELAIVVESVRVRGRVLFGRAGIPAELIFGGTSGVVRIPAFADEDGEFEVELPRGGSWRVDVESPVVAGRRWLRLPREKSGGAPARVEIVFPDNELAGRVVDLDGALVEGAEVLLYAAPEVRVERSAVDGSFRFLGVEEGEAALAARLGETSGSEELRVRVPASGRRDGLDLILLDRVRLAGAVESSTGGVPGAMVLAFPEASTGGLGALPEQAFSSRDGFFELSVSPSVTQLRVAVLAPGFPLQVLSAPADPRIPLLLPVGGEGGELVLRPGLDDSFAPGSVLIFHNGFPLDAGTLAMWAGRNGSRPSEKELRVPRLAAGVYTVCADVAPETFLRALAAGDAQRAGCRRVRLYEADATVVDLEELRE